MKLLTDRAESSVLGFGLLLFLGAAIAAPASVIVYVDSSAPVVTTSVWYKVGSYDEPLGSTGLSHMLEHMTYKHSDVYGPGDFQRIVNSSGGSMNGFTTKYYTGYYEDFASDRYELAMKLEAARMGSCVFPDSEFEAEHGVVSEERRSSRSSSRRPRCSPTPNATQLSAGRMTFTTSRSKQ